MVRRLLVSVLVTALGVAGWRAFVAGPGASVEYAPGKAIIHVETLGEYPTTIRHVRIEEISSQSVIFDAVSANGTPQIHNIELSIGSNSTDMLQSSSGEYRTVRPVVKTFTLRSDRQYRISLWGGGWLPSHVDLQLRRQHR
jgi:hypothetical protein